MYKACGLILPTYLTTEQLCFITRTPIQIFTGSTKKPIRYLASLCPRLTVGYYIFLLSNLLPKRSSKLTTGSVLQPSAMKTHDAPSKEILIAVMGVTGKIQKKNYPKSTVHLLKGVAGAGKSYFIKEVSGQSEVKVSDGLYSCTIRYPLL